MLDHHDARAGSDQREFKEASPLSFPSQYEPWIHETFASQTTQNHLNFLFQPFFTEPFFCLFMHEIIQDALPQP